MSSLYDVHEMNAHRAGLLCLYIRIIQLENRWQDLDEIWYGQYVFGKHPKIVLFNFIQAVLPT
jgi:hypothetical protein